jgi:hypothetical protein
LRSLVASDPFLTLADVTELLLSCVEPTLLRGRLVAAYEVPPRAIERAR